MASRGPGPFETNPRSAPAPKSTFFHDRLADDFLDRCDAVVDRQQAALAQRPHAALAGLEAQHLRARVLDDHVAQVVVEQHDLVDADAAFIARVVARLAAAAVVELLP